MPFTFCHPAAVLPLNYLPKKWISLTGLVIGSITPDFELFFRMEKLSLYSHSWEGLFWFDLPLAVLLCFVYHNIVHRPLIHHLPAVLKSRLIKYTCVNWNKTFKKKWPVVIICILLGAVSHIIWDGTTYGTMDFFNNIISENKHFSYYSYWSISSLIGGLVIAFTFYQLPADKKVTSNLSIFFFWGILLFLAILIFLGRVFYNSNLYKPDYIVSAISSIIVALILTSILFKYSNSLRGIIRKL